MFLITDAIVEFYWGNYDGEEPFSIAIKLGVHLSMWEIKSNKNLELDTVEINAINKKYRAWNQLLQF